MRPLPCRSGLLPAATDGRTQTKGDERSLSFGPYDDEHRAATVYDAPAYLLFEGAAQYNFPGRIPDLDALRIAAARIAATGTRGQERCPMVLSHPTRIRVSRIRPAAPCKPILP